LLRVFGVVKDDNEANLRRKRWAEANRKYSTPVSRFRHEKQDRGVITSGEHINIENAIEEADRSGVPAGYLERINTATLTAILTMHPELLGELNERSRTWPQSGPLLRALEERSQIKKFLNAQFDMERITLADERAVLAAGDQELKRAMKKFGITDLNCYRGDLAVDAANKAMKRKIRAISPDLAAEVRNLGYSWDR
jgi:hypothetical protein